MIKKSKKIIASLLMTLSLVLIFPMTSAFATPTPQEDRDFIKTCNIVDYTLTDTGIKTQLLYEKEGKYYKMKAGSVSAPPQIARSTFIGDYYAQADGTLVSNSWIKDTVGSNLVWRYFGNDYKRVTGYQTINGVKYYFGESNDVNKGTLKIGWFRPSSKEDRQLGEWHYSYPDGSLKEGWVQSGDGNWYYIYADGTMAKDTITPDGYHVNSKGICK